VCSLMMRDDGDIYDEHGGCSDIHDRKLRRTGAPIVDKNAFCSFCFETTLKKGFIPDDDVREEMKKMVTLPLPKKISLLLSVRNVIKSGRFDVNNVLSVLGYSGLFTNVGDISNANKGKLGEALRKCDISDMVLILCYFAGIKGEQLKSVPNTNGQKATYEKVCAFIKDGETLDMTVIKNRFTESETKTLLAFAEITTLLSGKLFVVKEARSSLFRTFEGSSYWTKGIPSQSSVDEPPEKSVAEEDAELGNGEEELFGGEEEETYEVEDGDETSVEIPPLGVRRPGDNHFLRDKFK